jgi:hypothetical protein
VLNAEPHDDVRVVLYRNQFRAGRGRGETRDHQLLTRRDDVRVGDVVRIGDHAVLERVSVEPFGDVPQRVARLDDVRHRRRDRRRAGGNGQHIAGMDHIRIGEIVGRGDERAPSP